MNKLFSHSVPAALIVLSLGATATTAAMRPAAAPGQKLQKALDRVVASGVPGAIALVRDGDRTVRLTSGYANLDPRTRPRATDRFRVGSVTKTFTATVVLQLVGEGKLSLDATVEQRLPGILPNGNAITIRRLLNMTSGLSDYLYDDNTIAERMLGGDVEHRWAPRELVAIAASHEPAFAPGAGWKYCNTCYVLLGLMIEGVTGNPVGAEIERRIIEPLGLRHTTFDSEPRIAGRHMHGYYPLDGKLLDVSVLSPSWAWSAGAIVSTADDVARFYRALLQGRLLRPEQLKAMETTVPSGGTTRYGMALWAPKLACGRAYGHDGGFAGYKTYALNSKDGKHQIVLFFNRDEDSFSPRITKAVDAAVETAYCG